MYKTIRKRTINKERTKKKDNVFIPYKRKGKKEKKNKMKKDEEDDKDGDGEKERDEDKDEDREDDEEGNKDGDGQGNNNDDKGNEDNFDDINKNKEEVNKDNKNNEKVNKENEETAALGYSHVLVVVKQEVIEEEKKPKGMNKKVLLIESDVGSPPFSPPHFCKHSKSDGGPTRPVKYPFMETGRDYHGKGFQKSQDNQLIEYYLSRCIYE